MSHRSQNARTQIYRIRNHPTNRTTKISTPPPIPKIVRKTIKNRIHTTQPRQPRTIQNQPTRNKIPVPQITNQPKMSQFPNLNDDITKRFVKFTLITIPFVIITGYIMTLIIK